MYQLQFNRNSGSTLIPQWLPMPEGRGIVCLDRRACMAHKRSFIAAYRRNSGERPDLQTRIASGRHVNP